MVFVKEPNNPYDPNAVAVQTLDGQDLGYMPRDINHRFLLDTCFGYVYSVGQTEQGLWGFQVSKYSPAATSVVLKRHELFGKPLETARS